MIPRNLQGDTEQLELSVALPSGHDPLVPALATVSGTTSISEDNLPLLLNSWVPPPYRVTETFAS